MTYTIGLDLGTTTVSGVLLDAKCRKVTRFACRPNTAAIQTRRPTRAEQDPRRLRTIALEVLAELASGGDDVEGIALTGQMHGLMCIDAGGEPVTHLITWQDQRTREAPLEKPDTLAQLSSLLADLDWHPNGCHISHGYGAATLFWLTRHRALARTHTVCTLPDWLAAQLTGRRAVTDPTLAASWGVLNLADGAWNVAFLHRLGLASGLLPPIRPSGAPLGGLTSQIARQTGLPQGIPVHNAIGDNQASFLASVAEPAESLMLNLGTGGQVSWMVSEFRLPTEAVETRPLLGGRFLRVGTSLCGGAAYAWLNAAVRNWLADFGMQVDEKTVYERLGALAQAVENTAGLQVRTTFLGSRADTAVQAGAIEGITLSNLRLGALARATLAAMVDELLNLYRTHVDQTTHHKGVVAAGGAVRQNPLLVSLIEERFELPVGHPEQQGTAALGAALLASGLWS